VQVEDLTTDRWTDVLPRPGGERRTAFVAPQSSIAGKLTYHLLPVRRRTVLANLRRAFRDLDDREIVHIAQASYGHLLRSIGEVVRSSFMTTRRYVQCARVENAEAGLRAVRAGKGVLLLTGHFGNWEVALPAAISPFPEWQGRIHIVRKRLPGLLDGILSQRFNRAGIKVIPRTGAVKTVLERLRSQEAVVFVLDQHAGGSDGVIVDFMGCPAYTFRSLAVIALATSAPVVPAYSYRDANGQHVVRFEEALNTIRTGEIGRDIRLNTQMYNRTLEELVHRHPEQWFWMHRRWKDARGKPL
jgi:KDO2-lipid IV(A) lauroyltransferase